MLRHLLMLILMLLLGTQPVQAQKRTPPPTPKPAASPPQTASPQTAVPLATAIPPSVVTLTSTKAPAPPTSVPSTPVPPTRVSPTPVPPTAVPTATALPPATIGLLLPALPTNTPLPTATSTPVATATVSPSPTATTSIPLTATVSPSGWLDFTAALPAWAILVAGAGLLLLIFVAWVIARFVHYTRQDLIMKQRMIAEDAATRLTAHRRDVAARLVADSASWRGLLAQIITDVTGQPTQLAETDPPTLNAVVPYLAVACYYFTPAAARTRKLKHLRGKAWHLPEDAQVELLAVWEHLVMHLHTRAPALPRQATWVLLKG